MFVLGDELSFTCGQMPHNRSECDLIHHRMIAIARRAVSRRLILIDSAPEVECREFGLAADGVCRSPNTCFTVRSGLRFYDK
jgi:hypothetical protein